MRNLNGLYQIRWLNGLGENLSLRPIGAKALQIAVAGAKDRSNVTFPEYVRRRKNEMGAQVDVKDGASQRRRSCQIGRSYNRIHRPEDVRSGIF